MLARYLPPTEYAQSNGKELELRIGLLGQGERWLNI